MRVVADVLVIGGGIAGAMAALAARSRGASVAVVRRSLGATALFSGAADVAPPSGRRGESLGECVQRVVARDGAHPYALVRDPLERLSEALDRAEAWFEGLRFVDLASENACLSTSMGTIKGSGGGLASILRGDLRGVAGRVGVVGFSNHVEYDAAVWARALDDAARRAGMPARFRPLYSDLLDGADGPLLRPHEVARRIEEDPAGFARSLRRDGFEKFVFPPVLAAGDPSDVIRILEAELGAPCGEAVATRLSVPGLRLQGIVEGSLLRGGVELFAGEARAETPGDVDSLRIRGAAPEIPPIDAYVPGAKSETSGEEARGADFGALVLATGKYLSGGIRRDRALVEAVIGLQVAVRGAASSWTGGLTSRGVDSEQAFFEAGVRVDDSFRPVDSGGRAVSPRLFACGDLLFGHDPARDGTGMGVACLTGYLAGLHAADATRRGEWQVESREISTSPGAPPSSGP